MEDFRLDQSGQEVQEILNGAAMQSDLTAETERATEAEQTLQGNIDAEATRAQGAEGTLQDNIDAEEARAKAAEKQNADDIDAIDEKIPSGASSSNKLATEEYVADAVATATATFRGTYNLVSDLHLTVNATEQQIAAALAGAISTADNNDYCFIQVPTSSETPTEIKEIDRYKFNGTAWAFEYKLNNSGFTAAQWAAINSGITSGDVAKLAALPTNAQLTTLLAGLQSDIDGEEARAKGAEGTLQDNIDAEEARAKAAEKQNADDIDAIEAVIPETASSENKVATESEINSLSAAIEAILLLIPSAATSLNKLADKAFVNSSIATATATFRGTYNLVNDLGLTTSATHAQIATALAGAILTADNNDYAFVQIPTSDAMPTEIAKTERYKFNGTAWEYEYDLNNSGFTADQWAAINSGITQALVTKLSDLPFKAELTTELGTLTSSITTINQKIPSAASQANKLVDTAAMESYIVQVLNVLTISYNVTSTDGHVTVQISQIDGKITSVAVSTSDIASAADLNLKASQADLTALANRLTTAEGNITTLGGRMATAEGNITSLGGRMTTAEGNITTINGNITSLGGRVSTNETDIANLQELYNSLQQSKPVPVDALPETGQQQGVIYRLAGTTSYSDYMWNGSSWVLMATYNNAIDPRPKKASQNLVTSGGVFDNMGALDVSELNATENPHTLAQYVDLSAALAAIPTDYQKGGMSIKYVCSSDNKYVQFRLMHPLDNPSTAAADFANTAHWQGVDVEPTPESKNFAESGGIAKKDSLIELKTCGLSYDITLFYYVKTNGQMQSNAMSFTTGILDIYGQAIKIKLAEGYKCLLAYGNTKDNLTETDYVIDDGGEYILASGYNYLAVNMRRVENPPTDADKKGCGLVLIGEDVPIPTEIEKEIKDIQKDLIRKMAISFSVTNSIVDNTGAFVTKSNGARTDYLPIEDFGGIDVLTSIANGFYAVAFYDESKTIIPAISIEPANRDPVRYEIDFSVSAYSTAKYVIVSKFAYNDAAGYLIPKVGTVGRFIADNEGNKLAGKKLSIIGDSISTYNGYLPTDYETYYPAGNVDDVSKTWWGKLLADTGMTLEVNNSYSGSCVSTILPARPAFASVERLSNLGNPDIIIIFGSHNDWYWEAVLGELWKGEVPSAEHPMWAASTAYSVNDYVLWQGELYKCKTAHTSGSSFNETYWDVQYDVSMVSQAYQYVFHYLEKNYPSAKIYCCTSLQNRGNDGKGGQLCKKQYYTTPDYVPYTPVDLDAVIREACSQFGVEFVDLDKCGITMYNCPTYTVDNKLHPNEAGMKLIKDFILSKLLR